MNDATSPEADGSQDETPQKKEASQKDQASQSPQPESESNGTPWLRRFRTNSKGLLSLIVGVLILAALVASPFRLYGLRYVSEQWKRTQFLFSETSITLLHMITYVGAIVGA